MCLILLHDKLAIPDVPNLVVRQTAMHSSTFSSCSYSQEHIALDVICKILSMSTCFLISATEARHQKILRVNPQEASGSNHLKHLDPSGKPSESIWI